MDDPERVCWLRRCVWLVHRNRRLSPRVLHCSPGLPLPLSASMNPIPDRVITNAAPLFSSRSVCRFLVGRPRRRRLSAADTRAYAHAGPVLFMRV